MTNLQKDTLAPDFTLPNDNNELITLSDLRGKPVVLYFYPKDNTSGCTSESLQFTKTKSEFDKLGIKLLGISPDSIKKHQNFREKHALTPMLLSDAEKVVANLYGVWVEKSMFGKKYMGIERSTFLIGKDGKIKEIWSKVKVADHAQAVLTAAKQLISDNQ